MLVKDWLSDFIIAHEERHPRQDWPVEGSGSADSRVLWRRWLDAFIADKVSLDEAQAASLALEGALVASADEHLPALLALIRGARQCSQPGGALLAWAPTPEFRKKQCEDLLDEIYNTGFQFVWDHGTNQFRCVPDGCDLVNGVPTGPYRRPSDEMCARIRFFARGLWKLLAPFRQPDVQIPDHIARSDWRGLVAALAALAEIRPRKQPLDAQSHP